MYIGPSISGDSTSKNAKANNNLQHASKVIAENPDNYQIIKLVRVLAAG